MRRILPLLVGFLAAALPDGASAQAHTAYTTAAVRMRAAASVEAGIVAGIPRGSAVRVDRCAREWCRVAYAGRGGWVAERYLRRGEPAARAGATPADAPAPAREGRAARSPRPASPSAARGPSVETRRRASPAGASARCRDGTYSYSRSRRGTCSHHGGVAVWL